MNSDLEFDLCNLVLDDEKQESLVSCYSSPVIKVHVNKNELLKLLGFDVENHKFYIESLVEDDHPRDNPTHVIIKVRVQSDCGVIKYG